MIERRKNFMWKRISTIAIAAALLTGMLVGCSSTSDEIKTNPDGKRTISIMAPGAQAQSASDDAAKNPIIAQVEEKLGVDLKLRFAASSNFNEKVTATMAADTYPNILKIPSKSSAIIQNCRHGTFWDITGKVTEKNADGSYRWPNLAQSNPVILHNISVDGKVYGVYTARPLGRNAATIRKDWMEKVGYKDFPQTVDEFIDLCRKFKNEDPDGDGEDNTTALIMASFPQQIQMFLVWNGAPNAYGVDANGELKPAFYFPEYLDGLKKLKMMNDEKLMNQGWATYDPQKLDELFLNGRGGIILDVADRARRDQNKMPEARVSVFGSLAPKEGEQKRVLPTTGHNGFFAFPHASVKNVEELDECLTLLDRFEDAEISDLMQKGIEGRHYNIVNGLYQKPKLPNGKDDTSNDREFADLNQTMPLITGNTNIQSTYATECAKEVEEVQDDNENYLVLNPAEPYISNTASLMGSALDDVISEANTKFILGELDEEGWKKAVREWQNKGGLRVVEEMNEAYKMDDTVDREAAKKDAIDRGVTLLDF